MYSTLRARALMGELIIPIFPDEETEEHLGGHPPDYNPLHTCAHMGHVLVFPEQSPTLAEMGACPHLWPRGRRHLFTHPSLFCPLSGPHLPRGAPGLEWPSPLTAASLALAVSPRPRWRNQAPPLHCDRPIARLLPRLCPILEGGAGLCLRLPPPLLLQHLSHPGPGRVGPLDVL